MEMESIITNVFLHYEREQSINEMESISYIIQPLRLPIAINMNGIQHQPSL